MNLPSPPRGRFAPSPTGPLHLGSLLAAVGSFCQARSRGGQWLLRIEDLDPPRTVDGAADDIFRTLEACAMGWDGEVLWQSRRLEVYAEALGRLQRAGRVYPCYCSRKEIARIAQAGPVGMIYPGTCRALPPRDQGQRALRLRTGDEPIGFEDLLHGPCSWQIESELGDFVLQRADGLFAYQLAVVVDDEDQGITEVVRGADLLDCTPLQLLLQQLLGYATPSYLHLPVLINTLGKKLSKQHMAPAVDRQNPGPALLQVLSLLGQDPDPGLAGESPAVIMDWAVDHWRLEAIPRRRELATDS